MSLVNYDPFFGVRQLQDDINRLFSGLSTNDSSSVTADWIPSVDINELDDKFQLYVDLPGVDPKDVDITLEAGRRERRAAPVRARHRALLPPLHPPRVRRRGEGEGYRP